MNAVDEETSGNTTRDFNTVLGATLAISLVFLFVSAVFGDAIVEAFDGSSSNSDVRVPVWERYTLPYETNGDYGVALEVGPYEILQTENEWNSTHTFGI